MNQITKPSPLGRGLSALFGDADASYQAKQQSQPSATPAQFNDRGMRRMPLTWLQPGAFQPRRHFDQDALKGLAESIKERGILEPLLVRPMPGRDTCEIIAGERRWRAAQMAGLHDVPVIVRDMDDRAALEFGLIENVQRQDLSPLEEAEGYKRLLEEFSHTQENLAKIVGKSRPHITNLLRILGLPQAVKQMIENGDLTLGHARAIVTARDPLALAQEIVKKGLNVRQAEALVKRTSDNPQIHKRKPASQQDADTIAFEKDLERATGLKVKIHSQGKSSSLTFYYHELEQLDELTKKLKTST
jgi:ParB family chromosome partitioning protein